MGLLFISLLVAPLASGSPLSVMPVACTEMQASMGSFFRWPTANPGMVAPVLMVFSYPVYKSPLRCSFTGKSIAIDVPPSYGDKAGFHLGTAAIPTKSDERYRLTRIEIRKPPQAYAGLGQALSHVMEMVLVHREENGKRWANIVVPFQVSTSGAELDIINPMINGVNLPSKISQSGYVMASGVSEMALSPGLTKASFSEFWSSAEVAGCKEKSVSVRTFMRTDVLTIGVDTFTQLSTALENTPNQEPTQPPKATWLIDTCQNSTGSCKVKKAQDMQAKLASLKKYQSQAVTQQRARKAKLDTKLAQLKNHSGAATKASVDLYDATLAAYNDLKAAASELISAQAHVKKIQAFATEAATAKWNQTMPKANPSAPSASKTKTEAPKSPTKAPVSLIGIDDQHGLRRDCSALRQSPVDIDTKMVVDPSSISSALVEPLAFRYMSLLDGAHDSARLQLSNRGQHLRVAVPPGSAEWPLGGVLSAGVLRGVSYIDIHVPAEHSVNGHVAAAELQLVHESVAGKPAMAVAVPLELHAGRADEENEWLKPLLRALPETQASVEVLGQPLGLLQSALGLGVTNRYYRYDGSLTKPPCLRTEWFILEEPGHISHQQLSDLGTALGLDDSPQRATQFMTSLVMRGSPHLESQVRDTDSFALSRPNKFRGLRRVQI